VKIDRASGEKYSVSGVLLTVVTVTIGLRFFWPLNHGRNATLANQSATQWSTADDKGCWLSLTIRAIGELASPEGMKDRGNDEKPSIRSRRKYRLTIAFVPGNRCTRFA